MANRFRLVSEILIVSGGGDEAARVVRSASPLGRAISLRFGKCPPYAFSVEVLGVNWSAGLLLPGVIKPTSVNSIESEFVDELEHDGLGNIIVTRHWKGDTTGSACRSSQFEQVFSIDVSFLLLSVLLSASTLSIHLVVS